MKLQPRTSKGEIASLYPSIIQWLQSVGEAAFPSKCLGCHKLFHEDTGASQTSIENERLRALDFAQIMAGYFCPVCRIQWTAATSPLCSRCGLVFKSREGEDHLCGRCLDRAGAFSKARAMGIYDQSLRNAIHTLKFKGRPMLAKPLGDLLLQTFKQYWTTEDFDMVAPVPLHRKRFRQRGFNQAYLLICQWQLSDKMVIVKDLLMRSRATAAQTGLDRKQRKSNIKNAFSMKRAGQSKGKRILLVDDVLTTGATADACARTLLKDGACQVDVLTLARAM